VVGKIYNIFPLKQYLLIIALSDCEELVGVTHRRWWVGFMALSIHMFAMKLFWEEKDT